MKISRAEARRIAELAHLEFDEEGLERMASEMAEILGYVEQLRACRADVSPALDVSAPPPGGAPEVRTTPPALIEENAPEWRDGFFVVPPVIE